VCTSGSQYVYINKMYVIFYYLFILRLRDAFFQGLGLLDLDDGGRHIIHLPVNTEDMEFHEHSCDTFCLV